MQCNVAIFHVLLLYIFTSWRGNVCKKKGKVLNKSLFGEKDVRPLNINIKQCSHVKHQSFSGEI